MRHPIDRVLLGTALPRVYKHRVVMGVEAIGDVEKGG